MRASTKEMEGKVTLVIQISLKHTGSRAVGQSIVMNPKCGVEIQEQQDAVQEQIALDQLQGLNELSVSKLVGR